MKVGKVWFDQFIPNLTEVRGYRSFRALDDKAVEGLPMRTFEVRFPIQPAWPIAHPAIYGLMPYESVRTPAIDLTSGDRELLMRFYKAAIEHQVHENSARRENYERKMESQNDGLFVASSLKLQRERIEASIEDRFRMERLFAKLKIENQDAWQQLVKDILVIKDSHQNIMHEAYEKQSSDSLKEITRTHITLQEQIESNPVDEKLRPAVEAYAQLMARKLYGRVG
jgi:hypothetical protein